MGADQSQWCGRQEDYYYEMDTEVAEIADQTHEQYRKNTLLRNRQKIEHLQNELNGALDEIQSIRSQYRTHSNSSQNTALKDQIQQYMKQYNELMDSHTYLQDEYEKCKASNIKLRQQQTEQDGKSKTTPSTLEEQNMKLEQINMDLQQRMTKLTHSTHAYGNNDNNEHLKNDNESLRRQIKEMSKQIASLQSELRDTQLLKDKYESDIEKYNTLNVYTNTLESMKTFDATDETANAIEQNKKYKHEHRELRSEILQLTEIVEQYKENTKNTEIKTQGLMQENEKLNHAQIQLQGEINKLTNETSDAIATNSKYQHENNKLKIEISQLTEIIEQYKSTMNVKDSEIKTNGLLQDKLEHKETLIKQLQFENDTLKHKLSEQNADDAINALPNTASSGTNPFVVDTGRKTDNKYRPIKENTDDMKHNHDTQRDTNDDNKEEITPEADTDDEDMPPFVFRRSSAVCVSTNEEIKAELILDTVQTINPFGNIPIDDNIDNNATSHTHTTNKRISDKAPVDEAIHSDDSEDDEPQITFTRHKRLDRPSFDDDAETEPLCVTENNDSKEDAYMDKLLSRERSTGTKASIGLEKLDKMQAIKLFGIQTNHDDEDDVKQATMNRLRDTDNDANVGRGRTRHIGVAPQLGPMANFSNLERSYTPNNMLNRIDSSIINTGSLYGRQRNLSNDSNDSLQHQVSEDAEHAMLMRLMSSTNPNAFLGGDESDKSEDDHDTDLDLFLMKSMMNVLPKD